MLFETPKCVCVCVRPADLFSSVSSIVYRAVQRFAEREEITMTGISKLSAAVEKALRGFFSPSSCSLTVFSFPLSCYSLIALSFSFPYNLPQHKHTHTLLLPHFSFSWQMQFSEATQSNMTCSKCYPHLNRCHKYNGNLNVWRFLIKIILCNYNI